MIKTLLILLQILFIVRFHLEISRISAFTEPANMIRKVTNPLVLPVKRLIPLAWAKKFASIKIAYLVAVIILFAFASHMSILNIFLQAFVWLIHSWLLFFQYGLFFYMIGSFIQVPALQRTNYFLHQLFEPVLEPIRKVLPAFGGLDFSPMILLISLHLITSLLGL